MSSKFIVVHSQCHKSTFLNCMKYKLVNLVPFIARISYAWLSIIFMRDRFISYWGCNHVQYPFYLKMNFRERLFTLPLFAIYSLETITRLQHLFLIAQNINKCENVSGPFSPNIKKHVLPLHAYNKCYVYIRNTSVLCKACNPLNLYQAMNCSH